MARAKRFNLAAAGVVALGDMEFIPAGIRVGIKASDSVKTGTLKVTVNGLNVFEGIVPIEPGTDQAYPWSNVLTTFVTTDKSQMIMEYSGTVTDNFTDLLWLDARNEPTPWG